MKQEIKKLERKLMKYGSWGGVGTARKLESVAQASQILKYRGG